MENQRPEEGLASSSLCPPDSFCSTRWFKGKNGCRGEGGWRGKEGHLPGKCSPACDLLELEGNRALGSMEMALQTKWKTGPLRQPASQHTPSPSLEYTVILKQVASPSVIQSEFYLRVDITLPRGRHFGLWGPGGPHAPQEEICVPSNHTDE